MAASTSLVEFLLLLLLCLILFNSISCTINVQCNEKDMNTLLNFKQGVIDPSGLLSSWFTEHNCCEWKGVQCDNITGRVTELNLPCHAIPSLYSDRDDKSNCLTGELDLSLLELEFLSNLNLSNNDFKAIQYNSVGNHKCNDMSRVTPTHECVKSSNLQYLDLSYNYDILIDKLHWVSNLSSLKYLNLNGFDLHKEYDWLPSVVKLTSLVELHLESCQLQNLYPFLQYANFTSLEVLNLGDNNFGLKLPSWLFNLSCDISLIDLSYNNIHGQPPKTLPNLRSIQYLDLSYNYLDGPIPNWFGQLEHLEELYLDYNSFTGPIPPTLRNLSSLVELDLSANNLNGSLPENLGLLFNLEYLAVDLNSFTGNVSQRNFLSLSNLKSLHLGSPGLNFDFDPEWIPPFQLESILLAYIGPKIPLWLFTQFSLKALMIFESSLSFEPHDKFWNLSTRLDYLCLRSNTIDADMSNVLLTSKIAWLHSNNFRSGLPRISSNVTLLSLANNSFYGPISPLLCHKMKEKSNLEYLDLAHNNLSGGLTDCWMHWKSLLHVSLEHNNLTGKIPQSMGLLSNLISLNLNKNKLFGEVPLSLKNCQNLWILILGGNKFCGGIPYWIGNSIKALQLRSNEFSGNVPTHICQLNSLQVLDFSNNRLFGPIPNCLHNITSMVADNASFDQFFISIYVIDSIMRFGFSLKLLIKGNEINYRSFIYAVDLSSNNLSGTMPSEIYSLTRLQSLNLSHNQLLGMIPQEIGNLKQLESIDLSSNQLSGEIPQSMSGLSFLGDLNLSFNNFMGKIPSGTQLEGFTNLSYMCNPNLCGPPLTKKCPQVEKSHNAKPMGDDESEANWWSWFYMGMGIGFATGFWAVLGAIFLNRTCRHAYFRFLDKLYVIVILKLKSA